MSHLYMRLPATDDDRGADSLLHDEGKHLREPSSASSGAVSLTYARLLLAFVISLVLCLTATHVLPASTDTPPPSPSLTPLAHSCPSCPSCPSPSSASASSSSCPPATPPASPSPSSSAWSWSSPVSDCPLGHVDVFVVLQRAELLLTSHLVRSLELFMPCYGYLHLFCDEDVERDMHAWVTVHERVRFHRLLDPRAGEDVAAVQHLIGYVLQQWVMLWADRLVEPSAEYVLFFDTDSIAGLPITCSSLFDEHGRVYMPYWTTPKQPEYYPSCKELVHNECARSFMAFLPLLFPVRMFEPFRQHLQMRMRTVSMLPNTSFNAMLAAWFNHSGWHTFSQFNLMVAADTQHRSAVLHLHASASFTHTVTVRCCCACAVTGQLPVPLPARQHPPSALPGVGRAPHG